MTAPPRNFSPPRRLLVRGVNWLGDAVMTTPALLRLREALPDTHITLLTHEKLAGLWPGHPAVDEVLTFGTKEGVFSVARRLRTWRDPRTPNARETGFEAAVVLPNSLRSGLEVALAGIPRRLGYAGGGRNWLLTQTVAWRKGELRMRKRSTAEVRRLVATEAAARPGAATPNTAHHIHHYLHLVAAWGAKPEPVAPLISVSEAEVAAVKTKFKLPPGGLIGLNAGAEYGAAKRWPVEHFIATARELHARLNCTFVVFGGPADRQLAAEISSTVAAAYSGPQPAPNLVINLAGETNLRELCATLRACRVVLTNDTGPMHVAAAVGTRVVALFGSTAPELTAPGLPGDGRNVILRGAAACAPCFLRECPVDFRCMRSLKVEQVLQAVEAAAK